MPSLGVARLVFLGHEVTPLAADEWRIPLIGLLVFKKSDIKLTQFANMAARAGTAALFCRCRRAAGRRATS